MLNLKEILLERRNRNPSCNYNSTTLLSQSREVTKKKVDLLNQGNQDIGSH